MSHQRLSPFARNLTIAGLAAAIAFVAAVLLRREPRAEPPPAAPVAQGPSATTPGPQLPSEIRTEPAAPAVPQGPGVAPAPTLFPRDPGEWQGMLVDTSKQAFCDGPASCGLAMACKAGKCGPCVADSECAAGEACVLDHCVPAKQLECHRKADCGSDALCVLSGYSSDIRGNAEMRASCQKASGGTQQPETEPAPGVPMGPAPFEPAELIDGVEKHLKETAK